MCTLLKTIPKGERSYSLSYNVLFLDGKKPSTINKEVILKEMFNAMDAKITFHSYLSWLFQDEIIIPEFEFTKIVEIYNI